MSGVPLTPERALTLPVLPLVGLGQTIKGVTHHFDDAEVAREFAEAVT